LIESATIESVAGTLLKGGPAAIAVLAVLLALLSRYRTSSTHSILRWLWRLIGGKSKSNDAAFNEFMDAQDNLMQFRFVSGKARTVAQMHSLINWGRNHDEDIFDINACGPHFNRELPGLKPENARPTRATLNWIMVGLGGIFLLLFFSIMVATAPGALVTVKDTNTFLLISTQSAKAVLNPGKVRLPRDQCLQPLEKKVASSGMSARDVTVVCELYADPESPKFIAKTLREQLWFFGPMSLMLLFFFSRIYKSYAQGSAAIDMAARLDRPRP
jgi:hypothetical protein